MFPKSVNTVVLFIVVVELFGGSTAPDPVPIGQCTKLTSCSCVYDDGTIVNLEPLDRKDGKPNFSNATNTAQTEFYSWNPCTPFTFLPDNNNTECENVAVCMVRDGIPKTLFYDLGNQDTAQFMVDSNGTLKLTYTSDQGDFKRITEITLQCMASSKFDFFVAEGEQQENNDTVLYKLLLASKYSCSFAPNINRSDKVSPLNAGEIFAIVLFGLIGLYLILGVSYQAFIKKESGKRLCPNHDFWYNLPDKFNKGGYKKAPMATESGAAKYDSIE